MLNVNSHAEEKLVFGITILTESVSDQNRIKKLSLNLLAKMREYYKRDFDVVYYKDEKSLLKDFKERKNINALVISLEFYFDNKDLLKKISKKPFIYKHSSVSNSQLYLISNKNSKINSFSDIRNKIFMNTIYMQNYSIWLDYLSLKKLNKSYKDIIKDEIADSKSSKALLDVYFNKADFTIIEKDIYEDMLLLNPTLQKNLTIIEKSPEIFFSSITTIHNDTSPELIDILNEILDNKNFKDDFREFLKLINLDSASRIKFEDLKEIETFYNEYKSLKKKNN
jgi:hypothetical protein